MSCYCVPGEVSWDTLVQNLLDFTLYTTYKGVDHPDNVLRNLSGRTFSAVVFDPNAATTVYARAFGEAFDGETGKVELLPVDGTDSRIKATFPALSVTNKTWDYASFLIHDITDTANPIKFVSGNIRLKISAAPVIAQP